MKYIFDTVMNMNFKKLSVLALILLIADQALKIWVKTSFHLGEALVVIPNWFQLLFIENNGAAFGMQLDMGGGFDWGKLMLSIFRLVLIVALGYYIYRLAVRKAPMGILVGLTLIFAGALGNIIDSALYGLIFSASTPMQIAEFGGSYAPFMMGKVVDMFYFPLFQWEAHPQWLSFLFDSRGYFFGPVFNLADSYISVAVVYMLIFQYKFFK
jgi:signal peptidase II